MSPAWKPGGSGGHPAIVGCAPAKWLEMLLTVGICCSLRPRPPIDE
ncbi:hypothetical protein [Streptomyces sp. TRM68416]|nr:hypothetical protein [Streptomyces sp. TRM68416]MBD0839299.1 hypothetical protein [Streptomyces sp. TRM68416]